MFGNSSKHFFRSCAKIDSNIFLILSELPTEITWMIFPTILLRISLACFLESSSLWNSSRNSFGIRFETPSAYFVNNFFWESLQKILCKLVGPFHFQSSSAFFYNWNLEVQFSFENFWIFEGIVWENSKGNISKETVWENTEECSKKLTNVKPKEFPKYMPKELWKKYLK